MFRVGSSQNQMSHHRGLRVRSQALVPRHGTKWCFVHTLGTQVVFRPLCSVSRRHFCKRSEEVDCGKTPRNRRKTRAHRDPVPTLVPTGTVPKF